MFETVVVTGGAGFIGSHIARELVKQNYKVKVIDNLFTGKEEYISDVMDKIEFIKADILNLKLLEREFKDVNYVLHQAALRSVFKSVERPQDYNNVNINGTVNVLEASRKNNVKRVIFASSSSAYGDTDQLPEKETLPPDPRSPYALTKVAGEHYCKMYYSLYGLETISLRYFNVFGPMQDPKSEYAAVIPVFITAVLQNLRPTIFGDGKQSRDFTYVLNDVEANIAAMKAGKRACGEAFNIANGEAINLNELLEKINRIMGKNIKPIYAKRREGDVMHTLADVSKAREFLNWKAKYSFDEGLRKTIEWYKGRFK